MVLNDASQTPVAAPADAPVPEHPEQVETLTRLCASDLLDAFGLGGLRRGRHTLELVARIPAGRLARQIAVYDAVVGESGLAAGGAWALERMARRVVVEGRENVPREGPLLLLANHPGLADAVALFAATPRSDLRVIAAERELLASLPNTSRHLITVPRADQARTGIVRVTARHLKSGGAVLTFPGGRIEPDPTVLAGATEALERWSGSMDLFARLVPGLIVLPAVVCGVLSPAALSNPLLSVRRERRDREWLAATIQMLVPTLRNVTTRVAFGRPVRVGSALGGSVREAVLAEARRLIERCEAG